MTDAEIAEQYERDGFLVFPQVIDADLLREMQGHVEWKLEKHPDVSPERIFHQLIVDDPFWIRLCTDPRLIDLIEPILGPDIALFAAHYLCKPAQTGEPVLWHQDANYWPLEPMQVTTIWLAGDDSTTANGCMRVIPGSHRSRTVAAHSRSTDRPNVLSSQVDEDIDESTAVDVEVPAGGASIHDPFLLHGSEPNRSDQRRIGLTLRYVPTTTRIKTDGWPAYICRGARVEGVNNYPALPTYRAGEHYPFRGCDQPPWA